MRIALIGAGKTGGYVKELAGSGDRVAVFDEYDKPDAVRLKESDVAILFVPGSAAAELIDPVLESGIPAAWGTTGFVWPEDLDQRVKTVGTRWILASNFSLGMHLLRRSLQIIGSGADVLKNPEYHIHEIHHTDKQDAPSGTALSWKEWLGKEEARITSSREGDVKGIHSLHVKTDYESIHIKHEAHDRAVFAHGALWAARFLVEDRSLEPGVYPIESIIDLAFRL